MDGCRLSGHLGLLPSPLPAYVQVMSASVGFVRVELYEPGSVSLVEGRLQQVQSQRPRLPGSGSEAGAAAESEVGGASAAMQLTSAATQLPRRDLLCNLRSILRKLGKRVLVGDQVRDCLGGGKEGGVGGGGALARQARAGRRASGGCR